MTNLARKIENELAKETADEQTQAVVNEALASGLPKSDERLKGFWDRVKQLQYRIEDQAA